MDLKPISRPVIYDYKSPVDFLREMLIFNQNHQRHFSIRQAAKETPGCSPSLVSQVLKGARRLTRDQLPAFGKIFKLNSIELKFIDDQLTAKKIPQSSADSGKTNQDRQAKTHILKDWLNLYVKDTIDLKGFEPTSQIIYQLLGGLASPQRIEKCIQYLLTHGFWRIDGHKKIVPDENALITTDEVSDHRIRNFHKRALEIAKKGIDQFPIERRLASTFLLTVNRSSADELKLLLKKFQNELMEFVDKNSQGDEQLVQVHINMTPIGGKHD